MATPVIAVLSGDLIASTTLPPAALRAAHDSLRSAAENIAKWPTVASPTCFTINRGDGWQIILAQPAYALRASLYIQAVLMRDNNGLQTKVAIATGTASLPKSGDLNTASGPAFVASGHALDTLKSAQMVHADGGAIAAATHLAGHIAQGWTQAQCRTLALMLPPDSGPRSDAAYRLGISRQAVDQSLTAATYPPLTAALAMIESTAHHGA